MNLPTGSGAWARKTGKPSAFGVRRESAQLCTTMPMGRSRRRRAVRSGWLTLWLGLILLPITLAAQAAALNIPSNLITTVAGGGSSAAAGGGPATSVQLPPVRGVATDGAGNLYIADSTDNLVFKVDVRSGTLSVAAGTGTAGYTGDGTAATSAQLNFPAGVATDSAGNLYIADKANNVIRKVDANTGIITTVAGTGNPGFSGDGLAATSAALNAPTDLAVDGSGNLYIADSANNRVREVNAATGTITTVAGDGTAAYSGDGGAATAAALNAPAGVATDVAGNLYIADTGNNRLRAVDRSGVITTAAGNGTAAYSGDGSAATSASLNAPAGVTLSTGTLYIADTGNNRVRSVNPNTGVIATVAGDGTAADGGDGGLAPGAQLNQPLALAADSSGTLYIADTGGLVRRVGSGQPLFPDTAVGTTSPMRPLVLQASSPVTISSIAVRTGFSDFTVGVPGGAGCSLNTPLAAGTLCSVPVTFQPTAPGERSSPLIVTYSAGTKSVFGLRAMGTGPQLALTPGIISTVAGNGTQGYSGDGGQATAAALNDKDGGLAIDDAGNLYLGDSGNNVVRKVDAATGVINTILGDGTASATTLDHPTAIALNDVGDIYIADTYNGYIRRLDPVSGIVATLVGATNVGNTGPSSITLASPIGLALDAAADLYFSDAGQGFVRELSPAGGMYFITGNQGTGLAGGYSGDGGPAAFAQVNNPAGMAVDSEGNLYIADMNNQRIRRVDHTSGIITTVAGNGVFQYGLNGLAATQSGLAAPYDVAVDSAGDLYIADTGNFAVRRVDAASGLMNTVAADVLPGDILAGIPGPGDSGDGGPATSAGLQDINGIALDRFANFYVVANDRIRKVDVSHSRLDFGSVNTGTTSAPQILQVTNTGNATLTVSGLSISPGIFAQDPGGGTSSVNFSGTTVTLGPDCTATTQLAPGASCSIAVTAAPTAAGVTTGTITLTDDTLNAGGSQQTVPMSVTGLLTQTITFPPVPDQVVGATVTLNASASSGLPVTYKVTGGPATLNGSTLTLTGVGTVTVEADQAGDSTWPAAAPVSVSFAVRNATSTTLSPSAATVLPGSDVTLTAQVSSPAGTPGGTVTFSEGGTTLGTATVDSAGKATVTIPKPATGSHTYTVTYAGSTTFASSTSSAINVTVAVEATLAPTTLRFADQGVHTLSATQTVTLTNVSAAVLVITSVTAGGDFSASSNCGLSLAPGAHCAIQVAFAPSTTGSRPGTLTVTASAPIQPVALIGAGSTAQPPAVQPLTGVITTIAGNGTQGSSGDGGQARSAQLSNPYGLAIDGNGDLYIGDGGVIRKVKKATGVITTVAGGGTATPGDNGPATSAQLSDIGGMTLDGAGHLYFAEKGTGRIRKLDIATGTLTTVAGAGPAGSIADGIPATSAELRQPMDVALDSSGNLYLVTQGINTLIYKVDGGTGIITSLLKDEAHSTTETTQTDFDDPMNIAVDSAGNLYYGSKISDVVRERDAQTSSFKTVAGVPGSDSLVSGVPATQAGLGVPNDVMVDGGGNLFISEGRVNAIQEVNAISGIITTVAGSQVQGYSGDGKTATFATMNVPTGLALDDARDLYVADLGNHVVRKIRFGRMVIPGTLVGLDSTPQDMVLQIDRTVTITSAAFLRGDQGFTAGTPGGSGCTLNSPLSAGVICTIPVTFHPTAAVARSDVLVVTDSSGTRYAFPVSGTGIQSSGLAQTTTTLTPLPMIDYASPFTLTATVKSTLGAPGGTVTFLQGTTVLATATVDGTGVATTTVTPPTTGVYSYTARYSGDSHFAGSTSAPLPVTVKPMATTTTLAASATTLIAGTGSLTLKATVGASAETPGGTVTFWDNGAELGTATLDSSGAAAWTIASPSVGFHSYWAEYASTTDFTGSQTPVVQVQIQSPLSISTAGLAFSAQSLNAVSNALTVEVDNQGNSALPIQSITIGGAQSAEFSQTNDCGASLAAGARCSVNVTFSPTVRGVRTATLTVASTVPTQQVKLRGIGVAGQLSAIMGISGVITTVAGGGHASNSTYTGDGGPADFAILQSPTGIAVDTMGNLYIADTGANVVRKVEMATGTITTVAGNGGQGFSGTGGPATAAALNGPFAVAVDKSGNLYIADSGNNIVRKVDAATGTITTIAGNGKQGDSGDRGPATAAQFEDIGGIAVDNVGNVYIADSVAERIRRVDAKTGVITTVAGNGLQGNRGDGGPATRASLNRPTGIAVDGAGDLFIADTGNLVIRKVDAASGLISRVAGNGGKGSQDTGDGGLSTDAQLTDPTGVIQDAAGNLYIADAGSIRKVDVASHVISTVAGNGTVGYSGDGGPATSAQLNRPWGMAVDAAGTLFIADVSNSRVREVQFGQMAFPGTSVGFSADPQDLTLLITRKLTLASLKMASGGSDFTLGPLASGCNLNVPLAAGTECNVPVTFQPAAIGSRSGTVRITDAGGAQYDFPVRGPGLRAFGAGGANAPGQAKLSKITMNFNGQIVGTTSPAQGVTLTDDGLGPLVISSLEIENNDFAETDDCPPVLPSGDSCAIQVTFTPSVGISGLRYGNLVLNNGATTNVAAVMLQGMAANPGMAMTASSGSGGSQGPTIAAGQTASYSLTFNPSGYSGLVMLSCSGGPAQSSCTVNPSQVVADKSTPLNLTVSVHTSTSGIPPVSLLLAWPLLGLTKWRRQRTALRTLLLASAVLLAACSGNGGAGGPNPGSSLTPTQYTIAVTADTSSGPVTSKLPLTVY